MSLRKASILATMVSTYLLWVIFFRMYHQIRSMG
ncbi:MAG: hypothetical protein RLZZ165_2468, partial [Bacteroidota bacterium]